MEVWRAEVIEGRRPRVLSSGTFAAAITLHVLFFLFLFLFAYSHGFFKKEEEEIIPIDLTVVVVENLNGNENEPPPMKKPDPPPPPPPKPKTPPPKPKPKEPDPPKALEQIVTNVVAKVDKPAKPEEPKKPDPPKKTAQQLREEKLKAMRESAKDVNKTTVVKPDWKPQPNGRTAPKTLSDAEIAKLLQIGYKPGRSEQLATSDEQLGYSLIKMAFEAKWDKPPWTDTLRPMVIRVWFGNGGRVMRYTLEESSGDARADQTIKSAASRVGSISTLPSAFIEKYRKDGVPVRFTVKPE